MCIMLKNKKYKMAFVSMFEVAIVIVVTAILLSITLISRSLITSAKIVKIQEEYVGFNNAIFLFSTQYECLPGDCAANQIQDLLPLLPNYTGPVFNLANSSLSAASSECTPLSSSSGTTTGTPPPATGATPPATGSVASGLSTNFSLNTGAIENASKRTCMMLELQAAGYLGGLRYLYGYDSLYNTLAGKNLPTAKFSKSATWDYRVVTPAYPASIISNVTTYTAPFVNGLGGCDSIAQNILTANLKSGQNTLYNWCGAHALILRNTSVVHGTNSYEIITNSVDNTPLTGSTNLTRNAALDVSMSSATNPVGGITYAIPSSMAYRLDSKFDDGLPYSGSISGARDPIDSNLPTSVACNTFYPTNNNIQENLANTVLASAIYNVASNDIKKGCIISYLILNS